MTLNLKRKDFAEVLLFQKQQTQVNWQDLILKIPFIAAMPYHLIQDISGVLYPQRFLLGEVVYDVDETNCDTLYFVESGKLQVQAKVTVTQETVIPVGKSIWQKTTKKTDVHYFIRQIDSGGFFGLEELVDIGLLKKQGNHEEAA